MKKFIKMLLLIAWLIVIYYFSSQDGNASSNLSNGLLRQIGIILNVSDIQKFLNDFGIIIRKLAHFTEYFILGVLMYINIKDYQKSRSIIFSLALCTLYALTDEIHQLFVSERAFAFTDIFIDSFGAIVGIFLIHLIFNKCFQEKKH